MKENEVMTSMNEEYEGTNDPDDASDWHEIG